MAAAAGKKKSVSLSLFLVVNHSAVEEELSNDGCADLGRRNLHGKMGKRAERSMEGGRSSRFRRGSK